MRRRRRARTVSPRAQGWSFGKDQAIANDQLYGQSTLYRELLRQRLHSALGLMFAQDGLPCLYYGTEQEFRGGNDPSNREDMWRPLPYLGQSAAPNPYDTGGPTFQWVQRLTGLRTAYGQSIEELDWMSPATKAQAKEKLAKFRDNEGLTFPLLSDPDKKVLTAWGAFGGVDRSSGIVVGGRKTTIGRAATGHETTPL